MRKFLLCAKIALPRDEVAFNEVKVEMHLRIDKVEVHSHLSEVKWHLPHNNFVYFLQPRIECSTLVLVEWSEQRSSTNPDSAAKYQKHVGWTLENLNTDTIPAGI